MWSVGEVERQLDVGVAGQLLLGEAALGPIPLPQACAAPVLRVEPGQRPAEACVEEVEQKPVDVDATEGIDALRRPHEVHAVLIEGQDRGLEPATTEVEDGDPAPERQTALGGVVDDRGLGVGHDRGTRHPGARGHLGELRHRGPAPRGRSGQRDEIRGRLPFDRHRRHDGAQDGAEEVDDLVGPAVEQHRIGVAQAPPQ